ncbi:MAG TPA: SCO family protein [Sphingomicrobium sp.]|nr:SCO family protein [Sphingomicrobium sp.]
MRAVRYILWGLVLLALAGLAVLLLAPPRQQQGAPIRMAAFGGPFTLTGADGRAFSSARLSGRPYAIFFGFTHCPDVCPTTLARLVRLRDQMGGDKPFDILFVTVDPERDGPAEVGKYADLFDSPVIGLTGSPAQIEQVKKQFGIFSRKVPDASGGYSVDHTATVLLFDRTGWFVATISPEEPDNAALAKLKRISA